MIRVTVAYPNSPDTKFDYDYYISTHMPLVNRLLSGAGLIRTEIDRALAGGDPKAPPPFHCIGYLYFNSVEDLQKGLAAHGGPIMGDIPNYTNVQPAIQISEIVGS